MVNHNTHMNPQKQSYYSVEYLNGEFSLDALDSFNNPHLNSNIDRTLIDASRPTTAVGARNNSTASSSSSTESSTNEAAANHEIDEEMIYGDGGCVNNQHELTYSTSSSSAQSGGRNSSHAEIRGRNRSSRANVETTRRVSASVDRHINLCVNNSQQIGVSPTLLMVRYY